MLDVLKVTVVVVLVALIAALLPLGTRPTQASGATIGIDADAAGNTATVLGTRDACVSVQPGDSFQVDLTVEDVSDLLAWEAYLSFDPSLLSVTDRDVHQFLAAPVNSDVFDISESVPDTDGHYRIGGANISIVPQDSSGSGVLARLTLEAQEPGLSSLSLAPIETAVGNVEPTLTDVDGARIGDSDDDGFFDGPMLEAAVAIDQPCPGVAAADILGGTGGGLGWWVLLAIALGTLTALGLGGFVLARRRIS